MSYQIGLAQSYTKVGRKWPVTDHYFELWVYLIVRTSISIDLIYITQPMQFHICSLITLYHFAPVILHSRVSQGVKAITLACLHKLLYTHMSFLNKFPSFILPLMWNGKLPLPLYSLPKWNILQFCLNINSFKIIL